MYLTEYIYKLFYPNKKNVPYYWKNSLGKLFAKIVRKFFSVSVIPFIPFNTLRILFYRMCGYKIGKNVFIGMRCYLDDLCYKNIIVEDGAVISYGVYFACHGPHQGHNKITIKRGAYIGMRTSIIAPIDIEIGERAIVGACTLVKQSVPEGETMVGVPGRILN